MAELYQIDADASNQSFSFNIERIANAMRAGEGCKTAREQAASSGAGASSSLEGSDALLHRLDEAGRQRELQLSGQFARAPMKTMSQAESMSHAPVVESQSYLGGQRNEKGKTKSTCKNMRPRVHADPGDDCMAAMSKAGKMRIPETNEAAR